MLCNHIFFIIYYNEFGILIWKKFITINYEFAFVYKTINNFHYFRDILPL